jgi:SAM-dependent methyltransferase
VDIILALKNTLPAPLRKRLSVWRKECRRKLLVLDRVSDFGVLRRVEPYRQAFGAYRGKCIDRYYIESFLGAHKADLRGRVLEVQSDEYIQLFGEGRVTHSDIIDLDAANPRATITADLSRCPEIADNTFDCIICTQTLLCIYDVTSAIHELRRILKPGGAVLVTLPGIAKICERKMIGGAGEDYWRFTSASATRLFGECFGEQNIKVVTYGNVLAAIAFLHGLIVSELTTEELDFHDPEYEITIAVRALKPPAHLDI